MPNNMPELSIIIVSYNVKDHLLACLGSIAANCWDTDHEIIVVDNNSNDGSAREAKETYPGIKLIANQENRGFARANNQGYEISTGEYILLLNPDTVIKPGAVKTVLDFMKQTPDAGLAACRLLNEDGSLQRSVFNYPSVTENIFKALYLDTLIYRHNRSAFYYCDRPQRIDYAGGAFIMVRKGTLAGKPLLNQDYFMYAEEKELSKRIQENGYGFFYLPNAEIIHIGQQSTGTKEKELYVELQKSQARYYGTHYPQIKAKMLAASHWLILVSRLLSSLPLVLIGKTKRTRLFWTATKSFEKYISAE